MKRRRNLKKEQRDRIQNENGTKQIAGNNPHLNGMILNQILNLAENILVNLRKIDLHHGNALI